MGGAKLGWFSRRMKRVGEKQQAFNELRLFGHQNGGLASAVGMPTEKQVPAGFLSHDGDGPAKTFAVSFSAAWTGWSLRARAVSEHDRASVGLSRQLEEPADDGNTVEVGERCDHEKTLEV